MNELWTKKTHEKIIIIENQESRIVKKILNKNFDYLPVFFLLFGFSHRTEYSRSLTHTLNPLAKTIKCIFKFENVFTQVIIIIKLFFFNSNSMFFLPQNWFSLTKKLNFEKNQILFPFSNVITHVMMIISLKVESKQNRKVFNSPFLVDFLSQFYMKRILF